jgi:hypothetical protein
MFIMDDQPLPRKRTGPKPGGKKPAETKEEREQRNVIIFQRFLAGHSEREIGRSVGLTGQRVHQIIQAELKNAARHRDLLTNEALAVYTTRLETLLKAVWPKVLAQDLKAVEVARRLMEQQARLYDFQEQPSAIPPIAEQELLDDVDGKGQPVDELTRFRMKHRRPADDDPGDAGAV